MSGIDRVLAQQSVHSVFQPIVELASGAVVAYEALARGPQGPLHRPDHLFAAARTAGRLRELDQLCRRAALIGAADARVVDPLTLFVNVEPEVLDTAPLQDLVDLAARAPGRLRVVLEITERALAARPAELLAAVERLRGCGWKVALDDVGADDMSLAFMPLLRPEVVKLDLRLVQHRPGPAIAAIVNAVNAYAERTGATILAEGIENESHLAVAHALGARLGQGWMFGRPQPQTIDDRPVRRLRLPEVAPGADASISPFACLPAATPLRRSAKPLLIEVSKHLEREAQRLGSGCIVVAAFQHAMHFTSATARRYRALADRVSFVGVLGEGLADEPLPGVRGATLAVSDAITSEWDLVVLAPHFAGALLARDLGSTGSDMDRTFEFALTYDRDVVARAASTLLSRVVPQPAFAAAPMSEPAVVAPMPHDVVLPVGR